MQFEASCPPGGEDKIIEQLSKQYILQGSLLDLPGLLNDKRTGKIALVSSFGSEAAVLLHMTATMKVSTDILFLDTRKHFAETQDYLLTLQQHLGLKTLKVINPDINLISSKDPSEDLHMSNPSMCCTIRKSFPLQDRLVNYDGWITGRKRYQGGARANLHFLERDGKHLKINPLIHFTPKMIIEYFETHNLPKHPLVEKGFSSIGCKPCTKSVEKNADPRSGRWAGMDKVECGIHLGPDGNFARN